MYGVLVGGRLRVGGCVSNWRDLWRLVRVVVRFW